MSNTRAHDVVNPEGLRLDGRRPGELRKIVGEIGVFNDCDGSSSLQHGQTRVTVKVFGPSESKTRAKDGNLGLNVQIINAPYSQVERKRNERADRRISELEQVIDESFKEVIIGHLFPRSSIDIQISILSNDGGLLHSCINAVTLALIDAGIPMLDYLCACSAAIVENHALLDLNSLEEGGQFDLPKFTVGVQPRTNSVVMLNLECRMPMDKFDIVKDVSLKGAAQIKSVLDTIVREKLEN